MNKVMLLIGIFILLIALVFLITTGDMRNARYIFAAGGIYLIFSYSYKQYPKTSKVLFVIFLIIFILAMGMTLFAKLF